MYGNFECVVGLEVHAQLATKSKLFCGCPAMFGSEPNTNVCPICLGHPGVLPVLNREAVRFATMMGIAVNGKINSSSYFARKNYFYPDLPKGYQISQLDNPIVEKGFLSVKTITNAERLIKINRIHLEEDAGKLIHDRANETFVDLNRCGVPLIEIVTEPDFRSASEASEYLMKIRKIVRYLGICDGNMEEGSLRCDANVSVRLKGSSELGEKTEIKNMNSFKNVEKAIEFEVKRQIELIEDGMRVISQTMLWNADKGEAYPMRSKEEAHDYRYFPEPDLLPILLDDEFISKIKREMPTLPEEMHKKFTGKYNLPELDAGVLTNEIKVAEYYELASNTVKDYKLLSNWVMTEVLKALGEHKIDISVFGITPSGLAELVNLISEGKISGKIAKDVFQDMLVSGKNASNIVEEKNLLQVSDICELEKIIDNIFSENPAEIEQYLQGKEKVLGSFVGKVMKISFGKANPKLVNEIILRKLEIFKNK